MSCSKSTGLDGLSPVTLKNLCDGIAPILCDVINESISTSEFPDIWKVAKIIPIFKSGLRNNTNNYRPKKHIKTMSCSKSTGLDGLSLVTLKNSCDEIAPILCDVIN